MPESEPLDMEVTSGLLAIKREGFFPNLIEVFSEDGEKLMGEIQEALTQKEARALEESAHSLKSASASIGAHLVAALASDLEIMGRENQIRADQDSISILRERFTDAMQALRNLT